MKRIIIMVGLTCFLYAANAQQVLRMDEIKIAIEKNHPSLKMLDAEARSMNEAAKGAYSWMAPELGAGFYMTPYNPENGK